jgi:hypothetical protein
MSQFVTITDPNVTMRPSAELAVVNDIRTSTAKTLQEVFNRWRGNLFRVWKHENPQALLTAWFNESPDDLKRALLCSSQTAAYLEQQTPGCTASVLAQIPPYTVNADGSITVTPPAPSA